LTILVLVNKLNAVTDAWTVADNRVFVLQSVTLTFAELTMIRVWVGGR